MRTRARARYTSANPWSAPFTAPVALSLGGGGGGGSEGAGSLLLNATYRRSVDWYTVSFTTTLTEAKVAVSHTGLSTRPS